MREFVARLITPQHQNILDVGSYNVNGCYRPLFQGKRYVGLDIVPGPNVDVVVTDPYDWKELGGELFDVVVSGQCLEHVEYPWRTMEQIARHVAPNGFVCIVVPSAIPEHRYPIDCYRYLPDGMVALATHAGLTVVDVRQYSAHKRGQSDVRLIAKAEGRSA